MQTSIEMIQSGIADLQIQLDRYSNLIFTESNQRLVEIYRTKVEAVKYCIKILNDSKNTQ